MSQINRPPIGLQSLLGSQNFGVNPNDLAQQVIGNVDLTSFWAQQTLKFTQVETTTAGVGSVAEAEVPNGKIWGILTAAFREEILAVNDDMNISIGIDDSAGGVSFSIVAFNQQANVQVASPAYFATVWNPPNLFWLPSGYNIRGISNSSSALSRDFSLDVTHYELDV